MNYICKREFGDEIERDFDLDSTEIVVEDSSVSGGRSEIEYFFSFVGIDSIEETLVDSVIVELVGLIEEDINVWDS